MFSWRVEALLNLLLLNSCIYLLIILLSKTHLVVAIRSLEDGSTAIPFLPTVVPLAVRSPYLGTFLQDGPDKDLSEMSPRFWTGTPIGWTGLIRVDEHVFNWMGNLSHWPAANNTKFEHTAASSKFTFSIGPPQDPSQDTQPEPAKISLHADFISPVTPNDSLRQSIPFSYLQLTVESLDDQPHQVEIYTDVNGLWCADDERLEVEWSTFVKQSEFGLIPRPGWVAMQLKLREQRPFVEESDRILHGGVWYSATVLDEDRIRQTYTAGQDGNLTRTQFAQTGLLDSQANDTFRPIRTRSEQMTSTQSQDDEEIHQVYEIIDEPVLAWAHSFGRIDPKRPLNSRSVLMSIGHVRSPLAQYMTKDEKIVELEPLWASRFKNVTEMIAFHLFDFNHVTAASESWNSQLYIDAKSVQNEAYGDTLAISSRQIFMAMEAARADYNEEKDSLSPAGSLLLDGASTMMMLKEISSNGNCQTVDVIAPMLPFLIYAAPRMIPQLLEPIFRYVATGLYQPVPTPHDLGDHYPNATGRNDFIYANLPLEESGNILAMVLACLRLGTCHKQVQVYYKILVKWADWLVENTLYPDDQRSTDDFFGPTPNQTSLVIKGIMGLRSMAEISTSLGQANDSARYQNKAIEFTREFLKIGVSDDRTHLLGCYGNQSSWSTQYNLFFDKLFNFQMFPDWVYEMQDKWYLIQAAGGPYGPPLDSRSRNRAKTDWLLWAGGASKSNQTREMFVNGVNAYIRHTDNVVFGDLISLDEGWSVGFLTRPVVGGHFSLLALETMSKKPPLSSHRKLFGTLDVDELMDNWGRQKEKVIGYGKTPLGRKLILSFGAIFLFIFIYRIGSRYLARRRSRKSNELYRSVVEYYNDDDEDDEEALFPSGGKRRSSKSFLQSFKDRSSQKVTFKQAQSPHVKLLDFPTSSNPSKNKFETDGLFELHDQNDDSDASENDSQGTQESQADWDLGLTPKD